MEILLANLSETEAFGRRLAEGLFPGAVVALVGPLGAGKTHLVRAIAEGMGISNPALVSSPTFVLIQEYAAKYSIYHFDAYRLKSAEEFRALGAEEYLYGDGVCLVEWADRVWDAMPEECLKLEMTPTGEETRRVIGIATGQKHQTALGLLSVA